MARAIVFDPSRPRSRWCGNWRHIRVIALIVAFALVVSPLGMLGMAEAHADTMSGMETMAMAHCPSQDDEDDLGQFDGADCRAACTALAIQLPAFQVRLGDAIETPYPNVSATPHEQPLGADPPPPRNS